MTPPAQSGRVALIGAGPGDPELLTLKAVRLLGAADVILHDSLVSPEVLALARTQARRILVGKRGHGPSTPQGAIDRLIVRLAQRGLFVVRLKGGDPLVFGRAAEELAACHAAGIPVEIVPGIGAAQGAAASLGIPLTDRLGGPRIQFISGHGRNGGIPGDFDPRSLADPAMMTALYMGRRTLPAICDAALAAGIDPATPALAMVHATRPDEQRLAGCIASIAGLVAALPADAPVLVLIGNSPGLARIVRETTEQRERRTA